MMFFFLLLPVIFPFYLVNVFHGGRLCMEKSSNPDCPGSLTLTDFLKCLLAGSAFPNNFTSIVVIGRGEYSILKMI